MRGELTARRATSAAAQMGRDIRRNALAESIDRGQGSRPYQDVFGEKIRIRVRCVRRLAGRERRVASDAIEL